MYQKRKVRGVGGQQRFQDMDLVRGVGNGKGKEQPRSEEATHLARSPLGSN